MQFDNFIKKPLSFHKSIYICNPERKKINTILIGKN